MYSWRGLATLGSLIQARTPQSLTVTFLSLNHTADRLLVLKAMCLLVERIVEEFSEAEAQLEND
jgi:hypothetical protein